MMIIEAFSQTGISHSERGICNQDRIQTFVKDSVSCIALSDGAGSAKYAEKGAEAVCGECCKLFGEHFDECFSSDTARLKGILMSRIYTRIRELAEERDTEIKQFGATMLCAVIDEATDRLITTHLGDGVIAVNKDSGETCFSRPMNGITNRYTYLTTSPAAINRLRIRKYEGGGIASVLLMSDGVSESVYNHGATDVFTDRLMREADIVSLLEYAKTRTRDDYSAVAIKRRKYNEH